MSTKARTPRRVVITGLGTVSPVGNTVPEAWATILAGKTGIGPISTFDVTGDYPVKIAAEVKGFDAAKMLGDKVAKHLDRSCQFAMVAADEALADAKMGKNFPGSFVPERAGVMVGSGIGGIQSLEKNAETYLAKGHRRVSPFMIPMLIANLVPGNISIRHGFKGPSFAHVSACATGNHSIGEAYHTIKWGYADIIVAGGTEAAITRLTVAGFANCRALSTSNELGPQACRPFDKERDGFVIAEGGACLILETLEHARARNANIYAEIVGYGATSDAFHITAPTEGGEGIVRAMRLAIEEAEVAPEEIAYVNAHGTSTPYNDKTETIAYKTVFGKAAYRIPVSSTKSMTGHLLGGAGSLEAVLCIKAMVDSAIPPTINLRTPDPECDLDYVPNESRRCELPVTLSNAMGFGGQNATLIFRKLSA
ncbi:MAG: beta-ketoacyl-ACP synthase II [Candidatus Wallbacteria bacterium]|nr:beta-ketoacyl-ACP synthase II [Candidatus Wallbacteria bacterium]